MPQYSWKEIPGVFETNKFEYRYLNIFISTELGQFSNLCNKLQCVTWILSDTITKSRRLTKNKPFYFNIQLYYSINNVLTSNNDCHDLLLKNYIQINKLSPT